VSAEARQTMPPPTKKCKLDGVEQPPIWLLPALAVLVCLVECIPDERSKAHLRDRASRVAEMDKLSERNFRRKYRLRRVTFNTLLGQITRLLEKPRLVGSALGGTIPVVLKLAVTLRFLAGGSYLDIASDHGMSAGSFYAAVWETLEAIDQTLDNMDLTEDSIKDTAYLERKRLLMREHWGDALHGVCFAVDGWVCKIMKPNDVDAATYFNR